MVIELTGKRRWRIIGRYRVAYKNEYEEGWRNLEKVNFKVDYILSHTGTREVAASMGYGELSDDEVELRQYLQRVADNTEFEAWYFGHFHDDTDVDEIFYCLYNDMVELY